MLCRAVCYTALTFCTNQVSFSDVLPSSTVVCHTIFVRTIQSNNSKCSQLSSTHLRLISAQRSAVRCRALPCSALPFPAVRCCALLRSALLQTHNYRYHAKYQLPGTRYWYARWCSSFCFLRCMSSVSVLLGYFQALITLLLPARTCDIAINTAAQHRTTTLAQAVLGII